MCELLSNNSRFVGQLCALMIRPSLQLTSKQRIIIQQFTARADLFLLKVTLRNDVHYSVARKGGKILTFSKQSKCHVIDII